MIQQWALSAELGDELQAGPGADTQRPDDVNVVQASHRRHVLWETFRVETSVISFSVNIQ